MNISSGFKIAKKDGGERKYLGIDEIICQFALD